MFLSGHISLFLPDLFKNILKESYPVLPAWDGSGHYAPTKLLSVEKYHKWKVRCQLPRYILGTSMILKEINQQYLTADQLRAANALQDVIKESVGVLEPQLITQLERQNPPSAGPRSSQDPGSAVPHLAFVPPPALHQVQPERRRREVSAAAGSAEQQAGPVGRGRKRPASVHGEEDVRPPPS